MFHTSRAHQLALAFPLIIVATSSNAGDFCERDRSTLFTCTFKGAQKSVEVCDATWLAGDMATYGFLGATGTVEKEIVTDKASLSYMPWNGIGNYISESVTFFTDDGYGYEVFWTAERGEGSTEDGGINVLKDGAIIASLQCDTGSVRQDLAALIDMIDTAQLSP
ncbi:hypothetical protein AB9K29_05375 [Phaeobacter italicus]|uniref:hypothetical protein n=1 Tax=Phaeobacter italicus TaxID=481446 RepID=UPI001C97360D|nr:hypothetical protein [Phaeobacter italicus]MBY6044278.1 hypothetical protein [Phaeobacter italicus]